MRKMEYPWPGPRLPLLLAAFDACWAIGLLAAGKIAGGIGLGALALVLVLFGLAVRRWTGKDVEDY
jgi:hypothetical protein